MKSHKKTKYRDFKENGSQPGSWEHFHFGRKKSSNINDNLQC